MTEVAEDRAEMAEGVEVVEVVEVCICDSQGNSVQKRESMDS